MRKKLLYKICIYIQLMLAVAYGQAQTPFAYKTAVAAVPETKFYTIPLSPQLLASCKHADLSDIRITDSAGGIIPYILQSDLPVLTSASYISYPIVSNTKKDSSTEIVIRNQSAGAISSLFLIIKNASATRNAILSGSENQTNWFVIDENIRFDQTGSSSGDRFVQPISFPLSNYRYFKLSINDKGLLPLNILQAGVYKDSSSFGRYTALPLQSFTQKDSSDQNSYLLVKFPVAFKIDKLVFGIRKPALYKRSFAVNINRPVDYEPVETGELSPGHNSVLLSAKTTELLVKIFNADNPPLVLDAVTAYQANQQLVTQLEKGKKYFILTGNATAGKPEYDLKYFKDSIPSALSVVTIGAVEKNPAANAAAKPAASAKSKYILWVIIGLVLILLLFMTLNMSKEVNKKQ